jgi:hypothetical protein
MTVTHGPGIVFVVGAARSGTTWLMELLRHHPDVAAVPAESHLFDLFLEPNLRMFDDMKRPGSRRRLMASVVSNADFERACRCFADVVFEAILRRNPGARIIVEKSPPHALHWPSILRIVPGARFIHIVRDPRSVVASLIAASRVPFGRDWAPRDAADAAGFWATHVVAGLRLQVSHPRRCLTVRYERLLTDPRREIGHIAGALGLSHSADWCASAVRACQLSTLRRRSIHGAEKFRRGEAYGWQSDLTPRQVRIVEDRVGPLMRLIGYEPVGGHTRRRRRSGPTARQMR